jgi:cell division protein ZapA (FtsZ GTPase activity inhibitor)
MGHKEMHVAFLPCSGRESQANLKLIVAAINLLPELEKLLAEARLEEAEWWHAASNCTQSEAREMDARIADLRRGAGE